jgi:hypothetical protein
MKWGRLGGSWPIPNFDTVDGLPRTQPRCFARFRLWRRIWRRTDFQRDNRSNDMSANILIHSRSAAIIRLRPADALKRDLHGILRAAFTVLLI